MARHTSAIMRKPLDVIGHHLEFGNAFKAIVVLLFTTSVFISKAERDYEAKRNQRLAELRKVSRK